MYHVSPANSPIPPTLPAIYIQRYEYYLHTPTPLNIPKSPTPSHLQHSYTSSMSPPLWLVSIPVGFAYTFFPRVLSLVLQIYSGVPLKNAFPREQPESKEVAMKDTDGYVARRKAWMDIYIDVCVV